MYKYKKRICVFKFKAKIFRKKKFDYYSIQKILKRKNFKKDPLKYCSFSAEIGPLN